MNHYDNLLNEMTEKPLNEDATNKLKTSVLKELKKLSQEGVAIHGKMTKAVESLYKLDQTDGSDGAYDLNDQYDNFHKGLKMMAASLVGLRGVTERSLKIVPKK